MRTLSEEMDTILICSILKTLEKTKGCERVRDDTIAYICKSCCNIFANSKMKKDDKIKGTNLGDDILVVRKIE